jgi:hypothetical protein
LPQSHRRLRIVAPPLIAEKTHVDDCRYFAQTLQAL